jgi:hypothetical protein
MVPLACGRRFDGHRPEHRAMVALSRQSISNATIITWFTMTKPATLQS